MTNLTAALVLAGGRSSRLGGTDKPLLEIDGRPIIGSVLDRLRPQCSAIAISANRNLEKYRSFDLPVLEDRTAGFAGPLAGLQAGLHWARQIGATQLLTVAGDTPFFPTDLLARLTHAPQDGSIAVASSDDRRHPTFALWPTGLAADLDEFLEADNRKVAAFIDRHPNRTIAFQSTRLPGGPVDPFFNVNTPADLAQARLLMETTRT